jgi:hypothetical protein
MTGIASGVGAPTSYVGQTFPATSPFSGYGFGAQPFGPQAQQYVQPLYQQQVLQQLFQIVPQQLHQLLQMQLNQLQNVQQQVHYVQQLIQILPQQLHQVAHLAQTLSHHSFHQPFSALPLQSPNVAAFGTGLSQHPWSPGGLMTGGLGLQPLAYPQTSAILPHNFGYAAQPGQLM